MALAPEVREAVFRLLDEGDADGIAALGIAPDDGVAPHPVLREWIEEKNAGHCYQEGHLRCADVLTPQAVRAFRDAVVQDRVEEVEQALSDDPLLIGASFAAGRGIAFAIHHWRSTAVAALRLEKGADIEALTTRGESPLAMQLRFGSVENVRFLLERGASTRKLTNIAPPSDTLAERVQLLLHHGWDIAHAPLLHDANHGMGARVRAWLGFGADPNAADDRGWRALHFFANRGTGTEAIRALSEAGADLSAENLAGETPLDLARRAKRQTAAEEISRLLSDQPSTQTT